MPVTRQDPRSHESGYRQCNITVLGFTDMPLMTFRYNDSHTVIATVGEFTADEFKEATRHIEGEFDWWYGEIGDGMYAYSITTEDPDGRPRVPDWPQLPELFQSVVLAGLRGTLPLGEGDERPADTRVVVHRR